MTRYRIVTYKGGYAIQQSRWDSLLLWVYHCSGRMDSPPAEYVSIGHAQSAIAALKRENAALQGSGEVVWTE